MPDLQPPDLTRSPAEPPSPAAGPAGSTTARPAPLPRRFADAGRTLAENAAVMLASARRVSLCEDDAHDAVQAACERYLQHRERVDPETATGWLATVARNEALRVRERRVRTGAIEDDDRRLVHAGDGPDDLAVREEEVALAREALGRLKPQERLALWMQAEGRSYDEIAEELSWTRTKVNRNISEGRASLRRTLASIATGEGCAAAGPRIERLADGTATAEDLRQLRPHLRRCAGCRGRLRRARGGRWGVLPPVLVAWIPWTGRLGTGPSPVRSRLTELVADRLAGVVPATSGAVTEVGLAITAGLAAVSLGVGVAAGGGGTQDDRPRARTVATAPSSGVGVTPVAAGRPGPAAAAKGPAVGTAVPVLASRGTTAAAGTAWSAVRRRAARERAVRRARERRARERRLALLRDRSASSPASTAPQVAAPVATPAPAPPAPAPAVPAAPAPAAGGGGSSSGGGTGPSSAGSAASEFGFE